MDKGVEREEYSQHAATEREIHWLRGLRREPEKDVEKKVALELPG